MQFLEKIKQTVENGKKPNFGPNFGPKNIFREFDLYLMLDIIKSYHCIQFQGKIMNQT